MRVTGSEKTAFGGKIVSVSPNISNNKLFRPLINHLKHHTKGDFCLADTQGIISVTEVQKVNIKALQNAQAIAKREVQLRYLNQFDSEDVSKLIAKLKQKFVWLDNIKKAQENPIYDTLSKMNERVYIYNNKK